MKDYKELTLVAGIGDYSKNEACIMSAAVAMVRLMNNEPLLTPSDELECVCPLIRQFLIKGNDSSYLFPSNQIRTESLIHFVPLIVGTKRSSANLISRLKIILKWRRRFAAVDVYVAADDVYAAAADAHVAAAAAVAAADDADYVYADDVYAAAADAYIIKKNLNSVEKVRKAYLECLQELINCKE